MLYIIAGRFKNRKLSTPKGLETRPTTSKLRQSLFNICQNEIENASFLDVFAGSGAMGLEALSRGAGKATFIDAGALSIRCIRENLKTLNVEKQSQLLHGDALLMLQKLAKQNQKFDLIYLDPPYGDGELSNSLIKFIDESHLLNIHGMLFIEDGCGAQINKEWHSLHLKSERVMGKAQLLQFVNL
jgi:16S rRNA (guanine(966)-N(2))-methyltransferase RsmD